MQASGKKSIKKYVVLLVAPFVVLIGLLILQTAVRFIFTQNATCVDDSMYSGVSNCIEPSQNPIKLVVNILSLVLGVMCVLGIMLSPLWIIRIIQVSSQSHDSSPPSQPPAHQPPN